MPFFRYIGSGPTLSVGGRYWINGQEGYFDEDLAVLLRLQPDSWLEIGEGSGGTRVTISATAPVSPSVGDIWIDIS